MSQALGPVLGFIKSLAQYDHEFRGLNFIQDFVHWTGNKKLIPVCWYVYWLQWGHRKLFLQDGKFWISQDVLGNGTFFHKTGTEIKYFLDFIFLDKRSTTVLDCTDYFLRWNLLNNEKFAWKYLFYKKRKVLLEATHSPNFYCTDNSIKTIVVVGSSTKRSLFSFIRSWSKVYGSQWKEFI